MNKLSFIEKLQVVSAFVPSWVPNLISNPDFTLFYAEMPGRGRPGFEIIPSPPQKHVNSDWVRVCVTRKYSQSNK